MLDDREYMYPLETDTIMVKNFLNLKTFGDLLDICDEDMALLNPSIKQKSVPQSSKYFSVRIPSDRMEVFLADRSFILDSASRTGRKELEYLARNTEGSTYGRDKIIHRVRSGDVLGRIAGTYHVSVADIKKWNNLYSNTIRVGQNLKIWLTPNAAASAVASVIQTAPRQSVTENGTKYYIVQPGDTLWDISKSYNDLSIEKIKKLNNLKSNNIKPGQKLVIGKAVRFFRLLLFIFGYRYLIFN
jgi:membrane-bound lytic murein transglycosylase D